MVTKYPAQIDNSITLPSAIDNHTPITGSVVNRLRDAIIAVESELGVKPSGTSGTVKARIDSLYSSISNIISLSGDLGGTLISPKVIGLQGLPISTTLPSLNDGLVWNGTAWSPAVVSGGGSFTAGGDLTGTSSSQTVVGINGATVPAAGALTTGNAPYVSGISALTYGALNLAGGAGWITGTLPVGNGGTGITSLGAGIATFLGTPSSANLLAAVTDETGTGELVFSTTPTFKATLKINNPANTFAYTITPAAIAADRILNLPLLTGDDTLVTADFTQTLTNKTISGASNTITNVAISTAVSGLGTGVATFLATPSSANLLAAVSDETGTGALVFGTSPNFTTSLGVGTTPSTVGDIRLPNTFNISRRNGTDTDNETIFACTSDTLSIAGPASGTVGQFFTYLTINSYAATTFLINGVSKFVIDSAGVSSPNMVITGTNAQFNAGTYITMGATPAVAGDIRVPAAFVMASRNTGNTADFELVKADGSFVYLSDYSRNDAGTFVSSGGSIVLRATSDVSLGVTEHTNFNSTRAGFGTPIIGLTGATSPYGVHGVGTQAMADLDQTPAAAVYCFYTIKTTDAITADKNLTLPAATDEAAYTKMINNTCTGAFNIIVKDSGAGTTVTIANGKSAMVLMDSRGATRLTADV